MKILLDTKTDEKLNGLEILCFFKRGVLNWLAIVFSSVRTEKEEHFRMGLVILFIRLFCPKWIVGDMVFFLNRRSGS